MYYVGYHRDEFGHHNSPSLPSLCYNLYKFVFGKNLDIQWDLIPMVVLTISLYLTYLNHPQRRDTCNKGNQDRGRGGMCRGGGRNNKNGNDLSSSPILSRIMTVLPPKENNRGNGTEITARGEITEKRKRKVKYTSPFYCI